ncbi:hypothetical protein NDU88_004300 [Pleurodeles waltl]|uniref:Uncharacterized protein n=1 Tax=Pleurodeles waltl TaxID=8319 RepID=A0AAV7QE28_PLEWA|nr:hypothetical protein NDU88_004300 [Pleurodeles waltl]
MSEECVRRALALLEKAGRMNLVRHATLGLWRPARMASADVAAAVLACSPPRSGARSVQKLSQPSVLGSQDKLDGWETHCSAACTRYKEEPQR